jgi:Tfp pilus assembly protein PilO
MKELKWQHVALVGLIVMVLGALAWFGKDGSQVLAGVLAILAALGFGYIFNKQSEIQQTTSQIKEQTNGQMGNLRDTIEQMRRDQVNAADQHRRDMKEMADRLATMFPPPADPPVSGGGLYPSNL